MNETVNIVYKIQTETQQATELAAALQNIQQIAASGSEPVAALLAALESIGTSVNEVNRLRDSLQGLAVGMCDWRPRFGRFEVVSSS